LRLARTLALPVWLFVAGVFSARAETPAPPTSPFASYPVTPTLATNLARYHMRAYTYAAGSVTQAFVLYRPQRLRQADEKVPVVVFLHALGEAGTDLNRLFIIPGIFDLTSPEFQAKHPCYVLAPQLVRKEQDHWFCLSYTAVSESSRVMLEVLDWLCSYGSPQVDSDRLYLVGLCSGSAGAQDIVIKIPAAFAATIPISEGFWGEPRDWTATNVLPAWVSTIKEFADWPSVRANRAAFQKALDSQHCDFQFTVFDKYDRPTWNNFMRQPEVWEWLFAKTNMNPLRASLVTLPTNSILLPACTVTSNVEAQPLCEPELAVDGSLQSKFVARTAVRRGDYLQVTFETPLSSGIITAYTGYEHGGARIRGALRFSEDGKKFKTVATFTNGLAAATVGEHPVSAVRVVATANDLGVPLVVREITLAPAATNSK
jgi:hypothetical protein